MTKELNKAEVKAKWLEELRSGNHKQTKHTLVEILEDGTLGYCCLGILEAVVLGNKITPQIRDVDDIINEGNPKFYAHCKEILGNWEYKTPEPALNRLIGLNDDYGWDFNQIADEIEKRWDV